MKLESPWTVYRTRFLVRARQLTEALVFTDALGREQSGRAGDYLVETSEGMLRITSQAVFEDIYVPLTQGGEQREQRISASRSGQGPTRALSGASVGPSAVRSAGPSPQPQDRTRATA